MGGAAARAYAVELNNPGQTRGVFISEEAFESWKDRHGDSSFKDGGLIPAMYHRLVSDS